jgi:hypothetical protein
MSYTSIGIGIRRNFATLGDRNFEPDQTVPVQYISNKDSLEFMSVGAVISKYNVGVNLPFDVGGVSYSAQAVHILRLYWNQGWITPAT